MWPLVLPTALNPALSGADRSEWTLQALIIRWRNQVVQHAAVTAPPVLLLQLNRLDQDGQKVHHPIALSPAVYLPCFVGSSCSTTSVRYSLVAVLYSSWSYEAVRPLPRGILLPRFSQSHHRR